MTRYRIQSVVRGDHLQSWDVLEGRTVTTTGGLSWARTITDSEWALISPYFRPAEIACKGSGIVAAFEPALLAYNQLRRTGVLGPHSPNSAYRSPMHNHTVKGGKRSRHLAGAAFDVPRSAIGLPDDAFVREAKAVGFNGFGVYRTFIHIDMRAAPTRWPGGGE